MYEIRCRTEVVDWLLKGERTTGYNVTNIESIALNFRKIAEHIIHANMAGHEAQYTSLYPKYQYDWRLRDIIGKIKAINPNYYPKAHEVKMERSANNRVVLVDVPSGDAMTEDELIEMYEKCGDLLHARNPFLPDIDMSFFESYQPLFQTWLAKLVRLLNHHSVILPSGKETITTIMDPIGFEYPQSVIMTQVEEL